MLSPLRDSGRGYSTRRDRPSNRAIGELGDQQARRIDRTRHDDPARRDRLKPHLP